MDSATLATRPSSSSYFLNLSNPNPRLFRLRCFREKERRLFFKSLKYVQSTKSYLNSSSSFPLKSNTRNPSFSVSCSAVAETPLETSECSSFKLQSLVSEFQSLSESIDRVKRLLHYANLLPLFDESERVSSNRVMGCTVQVWLNVSMDEFGRMRFSADSDSEITKGFCSCLVSILDGAFPEEVLKLKTEDLDALNIGLPGRAHSRVNTWHNVLISMQKRTKALVSNREGDSPVDPFPSLVVSADGVHAKGSYAEAQVIIDSDSA